jgi:hypothetical protein
VQCTVTGSSSAAASFRVSVPGVPKPTYRNSISHGAMQCPVLVSPKSIRQQCISSRLHKRHHRSCSAIAWHVHGGELEVSRSLRGNVLHSDLQQVPGCCCMQQPAVHPHGLGFVNLIHQLLNLVRQYVVRMKFC